MRRNAGKEESTYKEDEHRSEAGDTLIEILVALSILGIAGVALLTGFATAIANSSTHRQLATLNTSARAATNEAIAQVQAAQDSVFGTCPSTYTPSWTLSGNFSVSAYSYQFWQNNGWVAGNSYTKNGTGWTTVSTNPSNCTPYGPQLWTMTVTGTSGKGSYTNVVDTVVYDPKAPAVNGASSPTQLVFLQPTSVNPGTGTVGSPLSPQPLVAIEGPTTQGGTGIDYNDASSVSLQIASGPNGGTLSSSCSPVENDGIFSFGDCSLSAVGTYTLTATDTDGLKTSTTITYTVSAAPPAQLILTSSPASVSGVAGQSAALGKFTVTQEDYTGAAVNAGTGGTTVTLSSSSSGTYIFSTTQNAAPPGAPTGQTSIVIPAGSSSASFYYGDTKTGTPTITASSTGLLAGTESVIITPAAPAKASITPTPTSVAASSTTNMTLELQLQDQFGNNTTAGTAGGTSPVVLSLSSNSSKEFFSTTLGGTGTLNAPANVSFANGVGTATEYFGDEAAASSTIITAKNGSATWGMATVAITAKTTSDSLTIVSGTPQSAGVGAAFGAPLVVQDVDQFGNFVSGATVTFTSPATGASGTFVSSGTRTATATVGTNGQASSGVFTANTTSGASYSVSASTAGSGTVNFVLTNTAGSPAKVAITPSPNSAAASSTTNMTLALQLQDQYGNNVTSSGTTTLSLSSNSSKEFFSTSLGGTGTLNAPINVTFANGVGTATTYYGDESASTSTAISAANGSSSWGTATVAITAKTTGDTLSIVSGTPQTATVGTAFGAPLVVQDLDQFGNPVNGATVTFTAPATGGSGTFETSGTRTSTATIGTNGQASSSAFTANTTPGAAYNVSASTSGSGTVNFVLTNTAGPAAKVVITPTPGTATASNATNMTLALQLQDQYGNNVTSSGTTTLSLSSNSSQEFFSSTLGGTGPLNAPVNVSFANGVGTATAFYGDESASTTRTITAVNSGATWGTANVTITGGTPSRVVISPSPSSATASSTTNITFGLQLVDQFGNNATSTGTTTIALSSNSSKEFFSTSLGGTGTLNAPINVTFPNGVGTATSYYGDEAASASTTITGKNGANVWGTTTVAITAKTTGDTLSIVSGSPQSATVGTAFANPLVIQDVDQFNNPVSGATVTFAAPASGASGTFSSTSNRISTAVTGSNGLATSSTFTANTTAGVSYSVSASAPSTNTANFALTNVAGDAQTITVTSGSPQSATVATAFANALVATVTDQYGNAVSGATVTFAAPASGASGTFSSTSNRTSTAVSSSTGLATSSTFTANTAAGAYNVTATATGTNTANFALTNTAKTTGDTLTIVSGSPQSATVAATFANPLVVQDVDQYGNPVSGATVTFTAPASGDSGTFSSTSTRTSTATIGTNGQATSSTFTANTTAGGPYNVSASTSGSGTVNFALTNVAGAAKTIGAESGSSQNAVISTAFANPLVATVTDQYGNPISGATVTFTAPASSASGTFSSTSSRTSTAVTGSTGQATSSTFTANATTGSYNVSAGATGAGTVNFAETNEPAIAATSVASAPDFTGSSATVGPFTSVVGDTYIITAFDNDTSNTAPTPTFTITGGITPTLVQNSTNTFNGTTGNGSNRHSVDCPTSGVRCYQWAWYFTATRTSTSVGLSGFTSNTATTFDVLHVTNTNTSAPIVTANTNVDSGCNASSCSQNVTSVDANLNNAPTAGDVTLIVVGSDNTIGTSPYLSWNSGSSLLFGSSTSAASLAVYATNPATQNASASTTGFSSSGSRAWGSIAIELAGLG